jgi:hypothetical protein
LTGYDGTRGAYHGPIEPIRGRYRASAADEPFFPQQLLSTGYEAHVVPAG